MEPRGDFESRVAVFTVRSVAVGFAIGVLVAAWVGWLRGTAVGLAVLTGLAAGALALAVYVSLHDGRFDVMSNRRRLGVRALVGIVVLTPMLFVDDVIELQLSEADQATLSLLFGLTGLAAFALGAIVATLNHLDGDDAVDPDPRLHRLTPPPGDRRPGAREG